MLSLPHAVPVERRAIAHVLTSLCVGGGERMALGLASSQVGLGHSVRVVSLEEPPNGALGEQFERAGVEIVRVPKRPAGWDPTLTARLTRALRRARATIVHTHNPLPLVYATMAGRLAGARVVHSKHGAHPDAWHRIWLRRIGAAATHAFVAVSTATAQAALELREVAPSKLRVVANGVDIEMFARDPVVRAAERGRWRVNERCFVIGTVGRMAEVKNHPLLVRAVAPLLCAETVLVIAGAGPELARTAALCDELGVTEHVRFLGEVSDVPAVLSGLDVFALSSRTEGMPMALVEAMAASLPVVATSVGGVPEVVADGISGFHVPPDDEHAMRARLVTLRDEGATAGRAWQGSRFRGLFARADGPSVPRNLWRVRLKLPRPRAASTPQRLATSLEIGPADPAVSCECRVKCARLLSVGHEQYPEP
jgi:glycosyltransferase involved in cell wall biosynthesis